MTKFSLLVAGILGLYSTATLAGGPYQEFLVGDWHAAAYTDDATGRFDNCSASGTYKNGMSLAVSINHRYQWRIGFINKDWRFRAGETVPVELFFDGATRTPVVAKVADPDFLVIDMPKQEKIIDRFRRAYTLQAQIIGGTYTFELVRTSELLPALSQCVHDNLLKVRPTTDPTAVTPDAGAQNAGSPQTGAPGRAQASSVHDLEAINLATNFVLMGQFRNPRFLHQTELTTKERRMGAVWTAEDAAGAVRIVIPEPGIGGTDIAAALASSESASCKGKFASGRTRELRDDRIVFRGFATCKEASEHTVIQFYVVPRPDGGFVTFTVASNDFTSPDPDTVDASIARYREAALTVVGKR